MAEMLGSLNLPWKAAPKSCGLRWAKGRLGGLTQVCVGLCLVPGTPCVYAFLAEDGIQGHI